MLNIVVRSFRYRLYPTRAQTAALVLWLGLTRELYNAALQERRDAWVKQKISVSLFGQMAELPGVREVSTEYLAVPIVVLRGALRRLDRAFKAFFRRCKIGQKPGFPRFKSAIRWDTVEIGDLQTRNPICAGGKRIKVPFGGKIKFKQHRPLEGTPKAMRITRDAHGHWYVTLACVDVPTKPLSPSGLEVGIDLGLTTFAATSNGEMFANPRPMKTARITVERASRRVSRRKRGSKRRRKAARLLAIKHQHVKNVRREHHIHVARALVEKYGLICVEALNIKGLASSMLAKSVNDAAWGDFLHWLRVKAEEAGREVVEVNPRGTSQVCSECGVVVQKGLGVRVHRCPDCGLVIDRDVNAACNILRLGRSLRRGALECGTPMTREVAPS